MIYIIDHHDSFTQNVVHQFQNFDEVVCANFNKINENKLKKELPKDNEIIVIRNKIDLLKQQSRVDEQNNVTEIFISAKKGNGIELVEKEIIKIVHKDELSSNNEDLFMARTRHIEALEKVKSALTKAFFNLQSPELVAEELMIAQKFLSKITGEFSSDDLLGHIFGQFCIGK